MTFRCYSGRRDILSWRSYGLAVWGRDPTPRFVLGCCPFMPTTSAVGAHHTAEITMPTGHHRLLLSVGRGSIPSYKTSFVEGSSLNPVGMNHKGVWPAFLVALCRCRPMLAPKGPIWAIWSRGQRPGPTGSPGPNPCLLDGPVPTTEVCCPSGPSYSRY